MTKDPSTHNLPHDWIVDQVDFVTRLARSLIHDEQLAADAAQDALAAAIAAPPVRTDNLRGWLSLVVRRALSRDRRGQVRRKQREKLRENPDAIVPVDESVAMVETHRDLANEVLRLEEPYRTTVTLRYFEDLAIEEVAVRMGVPKNTARSRLSRGLAQLRERLEGRYGERAAWVAAMVPLARRQLGSTAGRVVLTATTGVLVKKFVFGSIAAVACLCLVVWQLTKGPEATAVPTDHSTASVATGSVLASPHAPSPTATLDVRDHPERTAVAVPASVEPVVPVAAAHRLVDAAGRAIAAVRMRRLGPQTVRWQGGDTGWISGPRESLQIAPEELEQLRSDAAYADRLFAQRHDPAQWRAAVLGTALPGQETVTDAAGSFAFGEHEPVRAADIELVESGWTLIARPLANGEAFVGSPAVAVRGRVVNPQGETIGGAFVTIDVSRVLAAESIAPVEFREMRSATRTGRFELIDAPCTSGALLRVRAAGYATAVLPVPSHAVNDFDVLLWPLDDQQRLLVDGVVVDGGGDPIANALVAVGRNEVHSDAGGAFRLQMDEVAAQDGLSVIAAGLQAQQIPAFGQRLLDDANCGRRLRLVLDRPCRTLQGVVLEPGGGPAVGHGLNLVDPTLLGYSFTSVEARAGSRERSVVTDPEGRFVLTGLADRPYQLRIWNPRTGFVHHAGPFVPGVGELVVQLPAAALGRTITGRCQELDGSPVSDARVVVAWCTYVTSGGGTMWEDTGQDVPVSADGRFAIEGVPGGGGVLVAQDPNGRRAVVPLATIVADGPITMTMASEHRWLWLLPDSSAPALRVSCVVAGDAAAELMVWRDGSLQAMRSMVVTEPTLIRVPLATVAIVVAGNAALPRRIDLDEETTHVHVRGLR